LVRTVLIKYNFLLLRAEK